MGRSREKSSERVREASCLVETPANCFGGCRTTNRSAPVARHGPGHPARNYRTFFSMAERVVQVTGLFTCSLMNIVLVLQSFSQPAVACFYVYYRFKTTPAHGKQYKSTVDISAGTLFIAVILWYMDMPGVSFLLVYSLPTQGLDIFHLVTR